MWTELASFFRSHRRRAAPLVLAILVVVLVQQWSAHHPSDVQVALPIGSLHASVTAIDLTFLEDGELVRRIQLRYPEGAPSEVRHTVELAPGRYDLAVDLVHRDGAVEAREGQLEAPAEGLVRVILSEPRAHSGGSAPGPRGGRS